MHVYAAGSDGYIPILWNILPSGAVTDRDVRYPASEKVELRAIGETAAVYRDRFRLKGAITIASEQELRQVIDSSGQFVIKTLLRYQACDDRICYPPRQLPVNWKLRYASFDQQRAPAQLQRREPGQPR
jgi:hypothetical protein